MSPNDPKPGVGPNQAEELNSPPLWHALAATDVEHILDTSMHGLSDAEVEARIAVHGLNQLEEEPPTPRLLLLARQFRSPLIYILVVAAVVTVALREYLDAGVIAVVLLLNALIGFVQESKAEGAVRSLIRLVVPRAHVVRNGREREVASKELVPGDVVLLESGGRVPADMRLVSANSLRIDESLLTGESSPVGKDAGPVAAELQLADRTCMAYTGAIVTSGRGRGIVVATGVNTELGAIAEVIRSEPEVETPLQQRMARFARLIGIGVGLAALIAVVSGVALGGSLHEMFLVGVALAVSAVPEGLPIAVTITLAIGVRRMARRNAIVRHLPAVETLGSASVIGSDKTGTLTENRMAVQAVWAGGTFYSLVGEGPEARWMLDSGTVDGSRHSVLNLALLTGVLTNEADVYEGEEGQQVIGDPTEAALLVSAMAAGIEPAAVRSEYSVLYEMPFEAERAYSASFRRRDTQGCLFVKGAPERVADMCSHMLDGAGEVVPVDPAAIHRAASDLAESGLRVLAMAYRPDPAEQVSPEHLDDPGRMIFLGLQGMMDPPRSGVREAIGACRRAGILVVVITGDHAVTAKAVAEKIGISTGKVLTGSQLSQMTSEQAREAVADVAVFARVSPDDKLRIVKAFQERGEVVAVTGDGVNDAPALKAAAIGVAMGKGGTDVAREAAEMVLADDNFVSIVAAVEEGRVTFDNVRKVTWFLVSTGAAEVAAILTTVWLQWPLLFLPAQLLWLNLVTNGLQDVALAFEPGDKGVLSRSPRKPREGVLSRTLWQRTALTALVMAAGTVFMFGWELDRSGSVRAAQSVALTTLVVFQAFQAGNARSEHESLLRINPVSNPFLLVATVLALCIHVAALYMPATQFVLRIEPIAPEAWIRLVAVAATVLFAVEMDKAFRSIRAKRQS